MSTEVVTTTVISAAYSRAAALLLLILVQAACSSGGSGSSALSGMDEESASGSIDEPVADDDLPQAGTDTPTVVDAEFPFAGKFVVDEYSPSVVSPNYEGIVEIVPSPLSKRRVLNGSLPRSYADGSISFRQPCGQGVSRIALADSTRLSTPITPCSSEIPNEGASPTDFRQSTLSPDGTRVAVEARAYIDSGYAFSTIVYDVASQLELATWSGGYNATWLPDGRLLMASNAGLFLLDSNLDNPTRLGDEIMGVVSNPDVSADGSSIVFEFNQQIWGMNIDGSGARELLTDGSRLRFPTWAPDGSSTIAYLALPSRDRYLSYILVADFESGQSYGLDLDPVLEFNLDSLRTINGPLSWNP